MKTVAAAPLMKTAVAAAAAAAAAWVSSGTVACLSIVGAAVVWTASPMPPALLETRKTRRQTILGFPSAYSASSAASAAVVAVVWRISGSSR